MGPDQTASHDFAHNHGSLGLFFLTPRIDLSVDGTDPGGQLSVNTRFLSLLRLVRKSIFLNLSGNYKDCAEGSGDTEMINSV